VRNPKQTPSGFGGTSWNDQGVAVHLLKNHRVTRSDGITGKWYQIRKDAFVIFLSSGAIDYCVVSPDGQACTDQCAGLSRPWRDHRIGPRCTPCYPKPLAQAWVHTSRKDKVAFQPAPPFFFIPFSAKRGIQSGHAAPLGSTFAILACSRGAAQVVQQCKAKKPR
jgi:hypothetical protein